MGTAALLTLILPYIPNVLDFLSQQLGRVLVQQSSNVPTKTEEQIVLETVNLIVGQVEQAHASWAAEDKRLAAVSGIRAHLLHTYGITLSDSEINLLIELSIVRRRAAKAPA